MVLLAVTLLLEQLLANRFYRDTDASTHDELVPATDPEQLRGRGVVRLGLLLALWVGPPFAGLGRGSQRDCC